MKTAFIDTCAIDFCYKEKITAADFNTALSGYDLIPVVGMYTTYELARSANNTVTMKNLFNLLNEINPIYYHNREFLYKQELDKLKSGYPVDNLLSHYLLTELHSIINNYT